jgi:hypothetical protein
MRFLVLATIAGLAACGGSSGAGPTPPQSTDYVPGRSYLSASGYVEYLAGDAPVILTAPHGGALVPPSIPDRTAARCGVTVTTVTDRNTAELVRAMQQRFHAHFGTYPHVVISLLARTKMDANRLAGEAACGHPVARQAYDEWHAFLDHAKRAVLESHGRGWYMDMHGHGHALPRLEIGYLLTSAQLDLADAALNATRALEDTASIRSLSMHSPASLADLLRGPLSLGSLYAAEGVAAVPSASDPSPRGTEYFTGGDNTRRHGCGAEASLLGGTTGGMICGVQIEAHLAGVRDDAASRERFADATARVLERYLSTHWGLRMGP